LINQVQATTRRIFCFRIWRYWFIWKIKI